MNSRLIVAFLGGAVLASGLMYVGMKRAAVPPPLTVIPAPAATAVPAAPAPATPTAAPTATAAPAAAPEPAKPSPMPETAAQAKTVHKRVARARKPAPLLAEAEKPEAVAPEPPLPSPPAIASTPDQPDENAIADDGEVTPVAVAPAPPHVVTLKAGTMLRVRIGETISAKARRPGDRFLATLEEPLVIDGFVIAARGARAEGQVVEADPAGRVKGVAKLALELTRIYTTDGQWVALRTETWTKLGNTAKKRDAAEVLGGSGLGALIGGMAGGGAGAAIGAAVGGMAGGTAVMTTRGPDVTVPVETRIVFRVADSVRITEKLS